MRSFQFPGLATLALSVCIAVTGATVTPAKAVSIDFASTAQFGPLKEGAIGGPNGVYQNPLNILQGFPMDGLQITSNGTNSAYMDSYSGGKRGGLGACSVITASGQCNPSNDDNLSLGEEITISLVSGGLFNWTVTEFRDDDHNLATLTDTLTVTTNGCTLSATTFGDELSMTYTGITSITYGFGGASPDNYYIAVADLTLPPITNTEVPEPGTLLVLGLGIVGLGIARRKIRT